MSCIICKKKVIGRLSPDLDLNGIGYCKEHKEDVEFGYVMLIQGDKEMFDAYIKDKRKLFKD